MSYRWPKKIGHDSVGTATADSTTLKKKGRPPISLNVLLQALLFRLREGCSWRALSIFAPHTTIYTRLKQLCEQGIWERILNFWSLSAKGQLWSIDSTRAKVHKHAQGSSDSAENQAIGKSRGRANTKIHALVDTHGRAVGLILTAGHRHYVVAAPELVAGCTGKTILADKAYDSDEFRSLPQEQELKGCIPPKGNRTDPASYHKGHYRRRHQVENFFQRIKEKRAVSTRYEKLASRYLDLVTLAAICDWLR